MSQFIIILFLIILAFSTKENGHLTDHLRFDVGCLSEFCTINSIYAQSCTDKYSEMSLTSSVRNAIDTESSNDVISVSHARYCQWPGLPQRRPQEPQA